jgi:hypothetical protein
MADASIEPSTAAFRRNDANLVAEEAGCTGEICSIHVVRNRGEVNIIFKSFFVGVDVRGVSVLACPETCGGLIGPI